MLQIDRQSFHAATFVPISEDLEIFGHFVSHGVKLPYFQAL